MKIYLANPYGFSAQQKRLLLPEIVQKLQSQGHEVVEPFSVNHKESISSFEIANHNLNDLYDCDAIFAIVNGCPPDEGVMIELGYAMALKKKIYLFRDDWRKCTDSNHYPLNLMIFANLPEFEWRKYYFTSVESIDV